jgi:hypothetical protein
MKPKIGLSARDRKLVADILNVLLADEYILYTNTRTIIRTWSGPSSMISMNLKMAWMLRAMREDGSK